MLLCFKLKKNFSLLNQGLFMFLLRMKSIVQFVVADFNVIFGCSISSVPECFSMKKVPSFRAVAASSANI